MPHNRDLIEGHSRSHGSSQFHYGIATAEGETFDICTDGFEAYAGAIDAEIIYRAMERDPRTVIRARGNSARTSPTRRTSASPTAELKNWQVRRTPLLRQVAFYAMLALIHVVVLGLLFWVAKHT
jgi:hypothetical protein